MSLTEQLIADIETRAAAINTPVKDVLESAGIDWSTWWRWKQNKSSPTLGSLSKITKSLEAAENSSRKAA